MRAKASWTAPDLTASQQGAGKLTNDRGGIDVPGRLKRWDALVKGQSTAKREYLCTGAAQAACRPDAVSRYQLLTAQIRQIKKELGDVARGSATASGAQKRTLRRQSARFKAASRGSTR